MHPNRNLSIFHRKSSKKEPDFLRLSLRSCKLLLNRPDLKSFDEIANKDKKLLQRRVNAYAEVEEPHLDLPDVKPQITMSWYLLSEIIGRPIFNISQVKRSDRNFLAREIKELNGESDFQITLTEFASREIHVVGGKLPSIEQFPNKKGLEYALKQK
jgi:hypothetical protein